MIKTQRYIDIQSVLGGFIGSNGKIIPIDFTTEKLDPRILYSGPAHYFKSKQDALILLCAENEFPLEWKAQILGGEITWEALGRHEPESANSNIITDTHFAGFSNPTGEGPWIYNGTPIPAIQDVQPELPKLSVSIAKVAADWNKGGVYNETDNSWVVPETTPFTDLDWDLNAFGWQRRQWMTFNINEEGKTLRLYPARKDSTSYFYGKFPAPGASQLTFSFFEIVFEADRYVQGVQMEYGPHPSSPITQESPFRPASKLSVITGDPLEMIIHYSNGETEWIPSPGPIYTFRQNARPWGQRYIQKITFP